MSDKEILKRVGARVQQYRLQQGLSVIEFADKCDLKERFIQGLEAGRIEPSLPVLIYVIKNLSVTMAEFFAGMDLDD